MSELWRKSALELAAMVRGREVSSREVVQAHLDRVEAVNPHVNAIVRLLPEQALAAADEADRLAADGTWLGPLHGVPFTVKENIDLAGTPTTQGVPALAARRCGCCRQGSWCSVRKGGSPENSRSAALPSNPPSGLRLPRS